MNQIDKEFILKQGRVLRPFEARIISDELRDRVQKFQKLLQEKRVKTKLFKRKLSYNKI